MLNRFKGLAVFMLIGLLLITASCGQQPAGEGDDGGRERHQATFSMR